jgi:hypothetical protein
MENVVIDKMFVQYGEWWKIAGPYESVRVAIDGHNRALVTVNNGTIQAMVNLALTALRELAALLSLGAAKIEERHSD